jgi:hypothetical protein
MAKKPSRNGQPGLGGRVTPKGTRPAGSTSAGAHQHNGDVGGRRPAPGRIDPGHARSFGGPVGPTRAGHHRGQR